MTGGIILVAFAPAVLIVGFMLVKSAGLKLQENMTVPVGVSLFMLSYGAYLLV